MYGKLRAQRDQFIAAADKHINNLQSIIINLQKENAELKNKPQIGRTYTCKCTLRFCNCNRYNTVTKITAKKVTYKHLSTNINNNRYWCEDETTHDHFLRLNQLQNIEGGE